MKYYNICELGYVSLLVMVKRFLHDYGEGHRDCPATDGAVGQKGFEFQLWMSKKARRV